MRPARYAPLPSGLALMCLLATCHGCRGGQGPSAQEREQALASALRTPAPPPSEVPSAGASLGHAVNVIPGRGEKRIEFPGPRLGFPLPILPGQGVGPVRFGATKQTIERLMGAACDDSSESLCRYIGQAIEFKLDDKGTKEMRISRKGREAKRAADGSVIEYGFFNGALLPDLYFGMHPAALQEHLGPPAKIEKISPLGADGFAERHGYDGMTLEYDLWSNGKLVLGAVVLTKSDSAAAANEKALAELAKRASEAAERARKVAPTRTPR